MTNIVVFGYGNLSRGDDALGPLVIEYIEQKCLISGLEIFVDFQLQIEHALDLVGRELILFVDASVSCDQAFSFIRLDAKKDTSYTTHAMSPSSVLKVYQDIMSQPAPPSFLLSIQAFDFELGSDLTDQARCNLSAATLFVRDLLFQPELDYWMERINHA